MDKGEQLHRPRRNVLEMRPDVRTTLWALGNLAIGAAGVAISYIREVNQSFWLDLTVLAVTCLAAVNATRLAGKAGLKMIQNMRVTDSIRRDIMEPGQNERLEDD